MLKGLVTGWQTPCPMKGLENVISFHAEENNDKRDGSLWKRCEALVVDDIERIDGGHPQ